MTNLHEATNAFLQTLEDTLRQHGHECEIIIGEQTQNPAKNDARLNVFPNGVQRDLIHFNLDFFNPGSPVLSVAHENDMAFEPVIWNHRYWHPNSDVQFPCIEKKFMGIRTDTGRISTANEISSMVEAVISARTKYQLNAERYVAQVYPSPENSFA